MTQPTHLSPLMLLLLLTCTITSAIPILTPSFHTIPSFDTPPSSSSSSSSSPSSYSSFDTTFSLGGPGSYAQSSFTTGNIITEPGLLDPDTSDSSSDSSITPSSSSSLIMASNNYQPGNSDILFSEYTDPNSIISSSSSSIGSEKEEKKQTETSTEPAQKVDPIGELIKDNPMPHQDVCCQTNKNGGETCWPGMFISGSLWLLVFLIFLFLFFANEKKKPHPI